MGFNSAFKGLITWDHLVGIATSLSAEWFGPRIPTGARDFSP